MRVVSQSETRVRKNIKEKVRMPAQLNDNLVAKVNALNCSKLDPRIEGILP